MNWPSDQPTENQLASLERLAHESDLPPSTLLTAQPPREPLTHAARGPEIKVGRRLALVGGKETDVFTMSLGDETIDLLPLKTWAQLDLYKWRVRGKLPGTPAGLEITFDHTKLLGHSLSPKDAEACAKLEHLFSEWLAMERETLELAKKKAQTKAAPAQQTTSSPSDQQPRHFKVEVDKEDQVHIQCQQGKEILASIGLNPAGFQSLISQGFMRKPHAFKTGALHNWVELDGALFSFEKGNNDAEKLEQVLNTTYLPLSNAGKENEIAVFANPASSTGFDIQFPAKIGGVPDNRRRPLGEDSLELLQDPEHCGVVQRGLVIKLSRPSFIFKQKTADGGERYLEKCPENLVRIRDEDGQEKVVDLSQPVNYLKLNAVELTAVFNHPAINRHSRTGTSVAKPAASAPRPQPNFPERESHSSQEPIASQKQHDKPLAQAQTPPALTEAPVAKTELKGAPPKSAPPKAGSPEAFAGKVAADPRHGVSAMVAPSAPPKPKELPNLWLKPILEQQPIRYDWLTFLIYEKIAAWAHNSGQGTLMGCACWFITFSDVEHLEDPNFKGIFLTEKGGFGFLSSGYMIRLENGAAFVGTGESALRDSDVRLEGVGIDTEGRLAFIVNDGYRSKFGVPEATITAALEELKAHGAELMSVREVLESHEPLEVVWTAPVEQANPENPQALETTRPGHT